ncbi:hypothetical protein EHQ92_00750 [Leptospira biflexa]|jgi:hypothetical protein|uniref:GH3 family domain-containing protein n=1 Tax=Leptospira biflexa TaxID=172 RepID=UPI001090B333|nr:GH3 auxin-responsive promoter family protein [Leptospira biflexa]TGM46486.1 hypothetical protein EHQ92_00750 [Leptospira biflexa]TGM51052.1 hypothetical protein EHQ88_12335 [Leptospira biflexa]
MYNLYPLFWKFSCYFGYQFFKSNLNRIEEVQYSNLKNILKNADGTIFGNNFKLSKKWTIEEYQKQIPISEYFDYEEYLGRILNGESNVLTKSKIKRIGLTSGSSGKMKYIPFTHLLANEFSKSISVWIFGLLSFYPKLLRGRFYFSVSPSGFPEIKNEYVKIGFDVDGDYLKPWEKIFANQLLVVPEWLGGMEDPDFVLYATALRLLSAKDLTFISVWNPTFIISIFDLIEREKEFLINDLQSGRFSKFENSVSSKLRNLLRVCDPIRAKELVNILEKKINWEEVWPNLNCVSLWTDSFAKNSFLKLREIIPNIQIESKGVIATEGMITIPFYEKNRDPISLLAYTSHFYEFMDEQGNVFLPQNLSIANEYEVLLTTGGGLYRYRIGDRFLMTGYYHQIPILKFLGRNDDVSDLVGEKLHEGFITNELLPELIKFQLTPENSYLRGNLKEEKVFYELVIHSNFVGIENSKLTTILEEVLCRNPYYKYARRIGQLDHAKVLISNGFDWSKVGRSSTSKARFLKKPIK